MGTIRLTMAQALVRYLAAQQTEHDGGRVALFAGVWAIFVHGNVAGIGEALHAHRADLPTCRAYNEQAMALAAIGFAKAMHRRRMMACTTSIGPGATNMVTAAAVAHVDRLPVLLLPDDVFASRPPEVDGLTALEAPLHRARTADRTSVIVIRTDPRIATAAGGHWWDVGIPEVSTRSDVQAARTDYELQRAAQRLSD